MTEQCVEREKSLLEWVKPDVGALCCLRLRSKVFDAARLRRFWELLPEANLQLGHGSWFGESSTVFRLGFGYLPIAELPRALDALSEVLAASAR
jgi:DNA-binding transcriptional MocR family regulator